MNELNTAFSYQKIVACNECTFLIEALIRPYDVDGNAIPPSDYVNSFKNTIVFDLEVIEKVLRETAGCSTIISINVSSLSIADDGFIEKVIAQFHAHNNVKLCLELTEYSNLNEDGLKTIADNVRRLRREGILIALDDFGSMFSSDKILFYVEFDYVKLDLFFTEGLSNDHVKFNLLLNTVKKIRDTYGYRIIVEGVEDSLTAELIKEIGLLARTPLFMQGYFFHRPASWSEIGNKSCHDCLVDVAWVSTSSLYEQLIFLVSKYKISTREKDLDALVITTDLINCIELILIGVEGFTDKSREMKRLIDESKSLSLSGKKIIVDTLLEFIYGEECSGDLGPGKTQEDILFHCLDVSSALFVIRDENGEHVYTNKTYDDFCGKKMKGLNVNELFYCLAHVEAQQIEIWLEHDALTISKNTVHSALETCVVGGVEMYFETKREPITIGNSKYILLSVQDVTESVVKNIRGDLSPKENIDPLTRAFNRHYLDIVDASNYSSCVFIDLDGFKLANDINGHDYGDLILKSICQIAVSEFRPTDAIFRYGGDEIVILSSLEDIRKLTDRILLVRSTLEAKFEGISFSFGVCSVGDSISEALVKSDVLMYKNKQSRKKI
ncbi:diguanylate cyclase [Aeromonas veronii]|uniref:bifunctional diguanylate cyclase/phosphodiesterase n=6 Tax=Aeromonas veronii TaxID=654 RepID=UPI002B2DB8A9|nr:diguanylate cyclase [Aeromonas veronii]BEE12035.1 diguanylate cyclase [Aeromonas veronii]